jgi:hypothetical protein
VTAGLLLGVVFVVLGVVAYSGRWKGWMRVRRGFGSTIGFAWLWLGAAFLAAAIGLLVNPYSPAAFAGLIVLAAILLLVAIVGAFWLPRFLLPRWYLDARGDAATKGGRA